MYNTNEIVRLLRTKKEDLQSRYPICELGLFGSYARGDYNENSDIDILVDFSRRIDAFDYIKLAHELEDSFNQKVDLVSRKALKLAYIPYVERNLIHV